MWWGWRSSAQPIPTGLSGRRTGHIRIPMPGVESRWPKFPRRFQSTMAGCSTSCRSGCRIRRSARNPGRQSGAALWLRAGGRLGSREQRFDLGALRRACAAAEARAFEARGSRGEAHGRDFVFAFRQRERKRAVGDVAGAQRVDRLTGNTGLLRNVAPSRQSTSSAPWVTARNAGVRSAIRASAAARSSRPVVARRHSLENTT